MSTLCGVVYNPSKCSFCFKKQLYGVLGGLKPVAQVIIDVDSVEAKALCILFTVSLHAFLFLFTFCIPHAQLIFNTIFHEIDSLVH